MSVYHSFLNHSFTDGHLGCFQYLAVVNDAAMNTGMRRLFSVDEKNRTRAMEIKNKLTGTRGDGRGSN